MTNRRKRRKWSRDDTELTMMSTPSIVWYFLFCYLPMFGVIIAFKQFRLTPGAGFLESLMKSETVWFDNFKFFFQSNDFFMLLRNTLGYNIVFIILGICVPVSLAIITSLIYSRTKSKIYQTLMFFPHFLSWVVISYFVYAFLSPDKGVLNLLLTSLGRDPVNWYANPKPWPGILIFMNVWKTTGYSMIIYLAAIAGIDKSLYEASVIDGASTWQQVKRITIPTITPVMVMMFILNVGRIFYSDFGLFYQVTQRIPQPLYNTVSTFDTFIYNALLTGLPIGKNAAAALFQSAACCITILVTNKVVSKIDPDSAII